jgi:hypothetical protein
LLLPIPGRAGRRERRWKRKEGSGRRNERGREGMSEKNSLAWRRKIKRHWREWGERGEKVA